MKPLVLSLAIVFVFLSSCRKDEETVDPTPVDLLTVNIEQESVGYSDIFFVVWDKDGKLLASKKYTFGEELTLTTKEPIPDNKISLGYLRYRKSGDVGVHYISVYTDLEPGFALNRKISIISSPEVLGDFEILMSNAPQGKRLNISTKHGSVTGSYGGEDPVRYHADLEAGATRYILNYSDHSGLYQELTNVNLNDEIEMDVNDFRPWEKKFSINLPADYQSLQIDLSGLESDQSITDRGYVLASDLNSDNLTTYELGYASYISKFKLTALAKMNGYQMYYTKSGDLPGTIAWPDKNGYTVSSFDPRFPSVSASTAPKYIEGVWENKFAAPEYRYLYISSPSLAPKFGDIPSDILSLFPGFEIKESNYESGSLTFITDGSQSYKDATSEYFLGQPTGEREEVSITLKKN